MKRIEEDGVSTANRKNESILLRTSNNQADGGTLKSINNDRRSTDAKDQ